MAPRTSAARCAIKVGMNLPTKKLLPIRMAARRFGVPAPWLRAEAEADRIPHLRAGSRILVDLEAVERVLVARAVEHRPKRNPGGGDELA